MKKNFCSECYYGHIEGRFYNPVETFSTKGRKILSQWPKTIEGKNFLSPNVPQIVPMEKYKVNNATMPKLSCRKLETFSAMCENVRKSLYFSNKKLRKRSWLRIKFVLDDRPKKLRLKSRKLLTQPSKTIETKEMFPEKNTQMFLVTGRMQLWTTPPKNSKNDWKLLSQFPKKFKGRRFLEKKVLK